MLPKQNRRYVFEPPMVPAVPISATLDSGSTTFFPVHRCYCVARNYEDHAREMGEEADKEHPSFFLKPADAVIPCDDQDSCSETFVNVPYPLNTTNLHFEVELVVALKGGGCNLFVEEASSHIYGYAVGVDLTRRDLQAAAKKLGLPWCTAKGFDQSAPISRVYPTHDPLATFKKDAALWLDVNGERRQTGFPMKQLIWDVPHVVSILSKSFELRQGDLIFTGTPAGVGTLVIGDHVTGGMDGIGTFSFKISP